VDADASLAHHDLALASLAEAIDATPAQLARALGEYDEAGFVEASEDPRELMPRAVL
jgi:hypothetical protein